MPASVGLITAFLSCLVGLGGTVQDGVIVFVTLITEAVAFVRSIVNIFDVVTVTRDGVMVLVGFLVCSTVLISLF
jgi:hypothetical protein